MKKILIFLILIIGSPLAPQELIESIQNVLDDSLIIKGDFSQKKFIPIFKTPIRSSGSYLAVSNLGILWHTSYPLSSTARIRAQGLDFPEHAQSGPLIQLQGFGKTMLAMLHGDLFRLQKHFNVQGEIKKGKWSLRLLPKSTLVKKAFKSIRLLGARFPQRIEFFEKNGDHTVILLSNIKTEDTLTPSQRKRFE